MATLKRPLKRKAPECCDFLPEAKRRLRHAELNMRGVLIKQSARIDAMEITVRQLGMMQLLKGSKQNVLEYRVQLSEEKQAQAIMAYEQRVQIMENNQAQSIRDLQSKSQALEQTIAHANTAYLALEDRCQRLERKLARQTIVITPRRSLDLHRNKAEAGVKKRTTAFGSPFSSRRHKTNEQSTSPDEMQLDASNSYPSPDSATKQSPYEWANPHGMASTPSTPSPNGNEATVWSPGQSLSSSEMQTDDATHAPLSMDDLGLLFSGLLVSTVESIQATRELRVLRNRPVLQASPPSDKAGCKRKSIDEQAPLTKKVRTRSRQIITPFSITGVPVASVSPKASGPSPLATFRATSATSGQLLSGASTTPEPSPSSSILALAKSAGGSIVFTPATMPDDQTIMIMALKGAYEMDAAMAKLTMQSSAQTDVQPPGSPTPGTDNLAGETKEQLHKAIDGAAVKPNAHEELLAPRRQPDDDADTSDADSMPNDDDNSDEDEVSHEKTPDTEEMFGQHVEAGQSEIRAPIKLKLSRKVPQTEEKGINAITQGMSDQTLDANEQSVKATYDENFGQARQSGTTEPIETIESMEQRTRGYVVSQTRRNLDPEVEAEDYQDWEGSADESDEGEYHDEDEMAEDADGEEEEEDEEDEDANFDNKYGWSQPQSDRIRYMPPPPRSFNLPSQPESLRLEEPAGESVATSIEDNASGQQTDEGLAEQLHKTRLSETQPEFDIQESRTCRSPAPSPRKPEYSRRAAPNGKMPLPKKYQSKSKATGYENEEDDDEDDNEGEEESDEDDDDDGPEDKDDSSDKD